MAVDDDLTISTAVRAFRIRRRTLRRRLRDGEVVGATYQPESAGWVFPAESLDRLGYRRRGPTPGGTESHTGTSKDAGHRRGRRILGGAMAGIGVLVGLVGAILVWGDDATDTDRVWVEVEARTSPGEEVGVVGSVPSGVVPNDRDVVPIDDVEDLADGPRVVLAGRGGPADVLRALERNFMVVEVDGADTTVRVFDRSARTPDAADVATGSSTTGEASTSPDGSTTTTTSTTAPISGADGVSEGAGDEESGDERPGPMVSPLDEDASLSGSYTVIEGDSFWSVAERVVGEAATDAEVGVYWLDLVDANTDRLVEPGNPDLILPGQVLELPPNT